MKLVSLQQISLLNDNLRCLSFDYMLNDRINSKELSSL